MIVRHRPTPRLAKTVATIIIAVFCSISVCGPSEPTYAHEGELEPQATESAIQMHRLYNRWSGEHFYTANASERDNLVSLGWTYEGVGWYAPKSGSDVHRLYNRWSGDHHFTTSASERDACVRAGWTYEGVGWKSGGSVKVYREYNPYAPAFYHNYTRDAKEHAYLCSIGWRDEGVGWSAVPQLSHEHKWEYLSTGTHPEWHGCTGYGSHPVSTLFATANDYEIHARSFSLNGHSSWTSSPCDTQRCTICGKTELIHAHDFGTVCYKVTTYKAMCSCGLTFQAGYNPDTEKYFTAEDSWRTHQMNSAGHGGDHSTFQTVESQLPEYYLESTHPCSCGESAVDPYWESAKAVDAHVHNIARKTACRRIGQ